MASYFRSRAQNPYLRGAISPRNSMQAVSPDGVAPPLQGGTPMAPVVKSEPPPQANTGAAIVNATGTALNAYNASKAGDGGVPTAAKPPPTPLERIEAARGEYEAKVPTTFKGRFLEALKTAGLGALQGAMRDPTNPLGGAIGGAAGGGLISAINPKTGRAFQFETIERPRIEGQIAIEAEKQKQQDAAIAKQHEATIAGIDIEAKRENINKTKAEIAKTNRVNPIPTDKPLVDPVTGKAIYTPQPKPQILSQGQVVRNPVTGDIEYRAPFKPDEPSYQEKRDAADADTTLRKGTKEEAAQRLFKDAEQAGTFFNQLTHDEQYLIQNNKDRNGKLVKPDNSQLIRAQNRLKEFEQQGRDSIRKQVEQRRSAESTKGATRASSPQKSKGKTRSTKSTGIVNAKEATTRYRINF